RRKRTGWVKEAVRKKPQGVSGAFYKEGTQSVVKRRQFIHSLWALASLSRKLHGNETDWKQAGRVCPFPYVSKQPPPALRFLDLGTVFKLTVAVSLSGGNATVTLPSSLCNLLRLRGQTASHGSRVLRLVPREETMKKTVVADPLLDAVLNLC